MKETIVSYGVYLLSATLLTIGQAFIAMLILGEVFPRFSYWNWLGICVVISGLALTVLQLDMMKTSIKEVLDRHR